MISVKHPIQPRKKRERSVTFDIYEQQLYFLEKSLERSEQAKDGMLTLLNKFESNFSKLEYELTQLNKRIDVLKRSCDNIDKTVKCIDQVEAKYLSATKVEKRIEQGVHNNLNTFLQAMDQADEGIKFFSRNSNFKGAARIEEQLLMERQNAIKQLESEFLNQLTLAERRGIDPYMIGNKDLLKEMISEDGLAMLHKIAKRLDALNSLSYRKSLVESRSRVIIRTLSKIYHLPIHSDYLGESVVDSVLSTTKKVYDVTSSTTKKMYDVTSSTTKKVVGLEKKVVSYLGKDVEKIQGMIQSNVDTLVHTTVGALGKINLGGDLKNFESDSGSKFIFFMNFYLKLLEAEKEVIETIIRGQQTQSVYESVIEISWKTFVAHAEAIASQSQTHEKVFALLNVLEAFEGKLQEGFTKVLRDTAFFGQEIELGKTFTKDLSQTIKEFKNEIASNNIPVFPDGSVHQATANAIGFIKRLFSYSSSQEILQNIYKLPKGPQGGAEIFIETLLKSVDTNIENKAQNYSDKPLRQVFICNNYHYVWSKLQEQAANTDTKDEMGRAVKAAITKKLDGYAQIVNNTIQQVVFETWEQTLKAMRVDNCQSVIKVDKKGQYGRSSRHEIKKRLSNFNKEFLAVYNTQRKYSVYGLELKERLRKAMIEAVIPTYVKFDEAFCQIQFTKNKSKYVSFSSTSMEQMLLQLYDEERETVESRENTEANDDIF